MIAGASPVGAAGEQRDPARRAPSAGKTCAPIGSGTRAGASERRGERLQADAREQRRQRLGQRGREQRGAQPHRIGQHAASTARSSRSSSGRR